MNYFNTSTNIIILLLFAYVISYIILYLATIYNLSASGKGSILDNPYLLKFMTMITTIIYYTFYAVQQLGIKMYIVGYNIWLTNDFHSMVLLGIFLLSMAIAILYMKLY